MLKFLGARFREPSTYAGLGIAAIALGLPPELISPEAGHVLGLIATALGVPPVLVQAGIAGLGLIATLLPETSRAVSVQLPGPDAQATTRPPFDAPPEAGFLAIPRPLLFAGCAFILIVMMAGCASVPPGADPAARAEALRARLAQACAAAQVVSLAADDYMARRPQLAAETRGRIQAVQNEIGIFCAHPGGDPTTLTIQAIGAAARLAATINAPAPQLPGDHGGGV